MATWPKRLNELEEKTVALTLQHAALNRNIRDLSLRQGQWHASLRAETCQYA